MKIPLLYTIVFLVVSSCKPTNETKSNESLHFLNLELIADKLIERSNLKKGEKVKNSEPGKIESLILDEIKK